MSGNPAAVLAIIPARGGSQGIPRKNIRSVAGKPLLYWTVLAAQQARCITRIIVSTDDEEIAEVARTCGAEAPFRRPSSISQADSSAMDVVIHALAFFDKSENYRPDFVVYLQPTSPLRTHEDIDAAYEMLICHPSALGVASVGPVSQHPDWMQTITDEGVLVPFTRPADQSTKRRQDLPKLYCNNGAVYIQRRETFITRRTWYPDPTYAYVMPPERSIDIDSDFDLYLADLILAKRSSS
jgi:CMP-N,N'-diacetyllegionaminic acid synthase